MKNAILPLLVASGLLAGSTHSQAATQFTISFAGRLQNQSGTTLTDGSLLQLVDLGANGVFDAINLVDGSAGAGTLGQWTSGDDVLLHTPLLDVGTDFNLASAFDLKNGPDQGDGVLSRTFTLNVADGTKIGLRWWPGRNAAYVQANFNTYSLSGGRYGEFTRNTGGPGGGIPLYGDELWIAPADGNFVTFDSFATIDTGVGGAVDATNLGLASHTLPGIFVPDPMPEPTSGLMALIGAAVLSGIRRRKA